MSKTKTPNTPAKPGNGNAEKKPMALAMLPRLGNVQAAILIDGEGPLKRPTVVFSRLGSEQGRPWEIEQVIALGELCKRVVEAAFSMQLYVPPPREDVPEKDAAAQEEKPSDGSS